MEANPLTILCGDALEQLRTLPDESVHCCVTSPPYWGLRDYGTAQWDGGEDGCDHAEPPRGGRNPETAGKQLSNAGTLQYQFAHECGKCGAKRIDSQLGLEKTPEEYVARMVEVFREVRRVLRKDGTLWLNLGDSYAGSGKGAWNNKDGGQKEVYIPDSDSPQALLPKVPPGLKPKDLCGIPWEVVKAMQRPYYIGRIKSERDRVWLAATIDAEGSICGFSHTRKDNGEIRRGIHITVTNTNRRMLDECFRIWPTSKKDHNAHGRGHLGLLECQRWIAHDVNEKQQLLAELYPYLICKKTQAMLAWNFCEISKNARGRSKNVENQEHCAWIVHALSKLNHLQSIDIPNWIKEPPSQYEDGWWLRSDIIWAKPNPMPESVTDRPTKAHEYLFLLTKNSSYFYDAEAIKEQAAYDGRQDTLLKPSEKYLGRNFRADGQSPQSCAIEGAQRWKRKHDGTNHGGNGTGFQDHSGYDKLNHPFVRNKRSVWTVATSPYPEAHFATYPPDLIKPCILVGTSAKGCCVKCGSLWERIVEIESHYEKRQDRSQPNGVMAQVDSSGWRPPTKTDYGWQPTCKCQCEKKNCMDADCFAPKPCTVLDPFAGSGTTGAVALELGRRAILIELNPKYVELIKTRCNVTMGLALA